MRIQLYILLFLCSVSFAGNEYKYFINLKKVNDDKISVKLIPPSITENEIDFCFPAMVPGTYEVYNFGRYITNLKVTGKNGKTILVEKKDLNCWKLSPANEISEITYEVDDTFDKKDSQEDREKAIFEPGGTNIEADKNFCINTHGFFGYFKNYTKNEFVLEFDKPKAFYPATGIENIRSGEESDIVSVFDYHNLIDSPILYTKPDTISIMVANTKVLVSSYSPNKKVSAFFIAKTLKELLNIQKDYLGGELPVNKYAFLFYFTDKGTRSGSFGALEHSYSSFYVMPEIDSNFIKQEIRDIAAHEFFHIVTPLNIHAKEIGEFDFNNPQMSEHLWLYEGMTEYAAHHAQAKGGLINVDDFLNVMMQKYDNSVNNYNDTMSFTWMSKNVLLPAIHPQYNNVYEKGAVIGMCLDILLRHYSDGVYGTQQLMKDLSKKYGKDKSFNDDELIGEIEALTYPQIGEFLKKHVKGHEPLPMNEVLSKIGIEFVKENISYEFTFGNPDLDFNDRTNRLVVSGTWSLDEFGKKLGFKSGDELFKLNNKELKIESAKDVFNEYFNTVKEGDEVVIHVFRPKKRAGKYKQKILKAKAQKVKITEKNKISLKDNISEKEKLTLKSWVGL
ncbi:MAG: peptidase M61 [Sphingobacteriaceae bacterium]|nr:peptidase M61 [Sphingobacteriaceae bacterium]